MAAVAKARSRASVGWRGRIRAHFGDGESERGAVLVEAAFIFPVFLLLLFGMIEFGFIFKDSLVVSTMSQAGARVGSEAGNSTSPSADYDILSAVKGASTGLGSPIVQVIIFDANPNANGDGLAAGTLPPDCLSQSVANLCNTYDATDLANLAPTWAGESTTSFSCNVTNTYPSGAVGNCEDSAWQPAERGVSITSNNGAGPDLLGVYVSVQHQTLTGFFHSVTLHQTTIVRLEPQSFQ